jgi:hypothetical protein
VYGLYAGKTCYLEYHPCPRVSSRAGRPLAIIHRSAHAVDRSAPRRYLFSALCHVPTWDPEQVTARESTSPSDRDFFVSYHESDRSWAEWIAWQLEDCGYRVLIQAWDFVPGTNWIQEMHAGLQNSARLIIVLSPAYLAHSTFGAAEWQITWASDPTGAQRRVIPVRVEPCQRPGLLSGLVSVDLFDIPASTAFARLQSTIRDAMAGRAKPNKAPKFPGIGGHEQPSSIAIPPPPAFPADTEHDQSFDAEWSPDQHHLGRLIFNAWHRSLDTAQVRWPDYNYLEQEVRKRADADAAEVLASYPVLGTIGVNSSYYSYVSYDRMCLSRPDGPVRLTVAGLARATRGGQDAAGSFFALLEHAGQTRAAARLDPYDPQPVVITNQSFTAEHCVAPEVGVAMYDLISREPYAVTGIRQRQHNPDDGTWTAEVAVQALMFGNGTTLVNYIQQIQQYLDQVPPPGNFTYTVMAENARGFQIGSNNVQINKFGAQRYD